MAIHTMWKGGLPHTGVRRPGAWGAYYVKIDIEGHDKVALQSMLEAGLRPQYVSVENGNDGMLKLFKDAGYTDFKYVQQRDIPGTRAAVAPLEGRGADHVFPPGRAGRSARRRPDRGWITKPLGRPYPVSGTLTGTPRIRSMTTRGTAGSTCTPGWNGFRQGRRAVKREIFDAGPRLTVAICTYRRFDVLLQLPGPSVRYWRRHAL